MPDRRDLRALSSKNALPVRELKAAVAAPTVSRSIEMGVCGQVDRDACVVDRLKAAFALPSRTVGILVQKGVRRKRHGITAAIDLEETPLAGPFGAKVGIGEVAVFGHCNRNAGIGRRCVAAFAFPAGTRRIVGKVGVFRKDDQNAGL
ncbi:MAG: hypothetical protein AAFR10_12535 [Pseudomonadota bacterium]